jgi:hypothetical protein
VEYALWALKLDVKIASVQDPQTFGDLLYAVVTGQRNAEDSSRKAAATRDGLRRRRERGEPVGAIPVGYRHEPVVDTDGRPKLQKGGGVETRRVIDPPAAALVERIMAAVESGATFGDVGRALIDERKKTARGGRWSTRAVRRVVLNEDYTGTTGYPAIIERDRWERIIAGLARMDAAAVHSRKGGRRASEDYILRGVAFCAVCGAPMYVRRQAAGRVYVCKNRRECTRICDASPIPAAEVEPYTLQHLADFRLDVQAWLEERVAERSGERIALERGADDLRDEARRMDRRIEGTRRQHAAALDSDDDVVAAAALREIARYEGERDAVANRVAAADARVAEWTAEPGMDAALDYYNEINAVISGRLSRARGAAALNAELRRLLAGAWMVKDEHRGVVVDFVLSGEPRFLFSELPEAFPCPGAEVRSRIRLRREDRTVVRVGGKHAEHWRFDLPAEPDHRASSMAQFGSHPRAFASGRPQARQLEIPTRLRLTIP